jgi:hypothetical protein
MQAAASNPDAIETEATQYAEARTFCSMAFDRPGWSIRATP